MMDLETVCLETSKQTIKVNNNYYAQSGDFWVKHNAYAWVPY